MKVVVTLCLVACLSACSTTIYVVRHAEKAAATMSSDVDLSAAGQQRALALKDFMVSKKLDSIYATQYKRTAQTVQPTANEKHITINQYLAAKSDSLLPRLSNLKGKRFLVAGHSNTVPAMLRSIGLSPSMQEIPENDFDNLFTVTIKWFFGRKMHLKEGTYGAVSP